MLSAPHSFTPLLFDMCGDNPHIVTALAELRANDYSLPCFGGWVPVSCGITAFINSINLRKRAG